jgi:hypothetical protein
MLRFAFVLTVSLTLAPLLGCDAASPTAADAAGGDTTAAQGCRSDGDCAADGTESCLAPGESAGCGVCLTAERPCEDDTGCGAGEYCREYKNPCTLTYCSPAGLLSTMCTSKCTADSCGADATCGADGRCQAEPCSDGSYTCAAPLVCDPTASGVDGHGCLRPSCTTDAECGAGGFCVEGKCYDALGQCMPPVA